MEAAVGAETKCPCCNNPWSRAVGDILSTMCLECKEEEEDPKTESGTTFGLSRNNMDPNTDPSENFYVYANGGWMAQHPIPAGYPSWNTFVTLHVKSQEDCKALLEALLLKDDQELNENERKLAAFYTAALDEESIEKLGVTPLLPVFEKIDEIVATYQSGNGKEYAKLIGEFAAKYGVYPFMNTGPSPDADNSSHTLCNFSQGGIGLPDRDYYFAEDKEEIRTKYRAHVGNMLKLASIVDASEMEEASQKVFNFELSLAEKHMTRTENRDPHATCNKMKIDELDNSFDFASYVLGSMGKSAEDIGEVNVRNVAALDRAAQVASTAEPETLKLYLQWKVITSSASYLSSAFVDENFDFFERTLSGTQEMKPRWKRAMAFTEAALGEALGQIYCSNYFDEECKTRALEIVESVRQALEDRLKEVDWMKAESTRAAALQKMSKFKVKIGYPNKWIDYSSLEIEQGQNFLEMVFHSRSFDHKRECAEMNAPTDHYHPSLNEVVFPAAILQHPFFDKDADDSVNFGSMGAVVGHEMTHAYDDKGCKYNSDGALQNWWTEEDAAEYESRVSVMVEQANNFEVYGKNVQGKLTSGENIADLGGLRLALRALKGHHSYDSSAKIDGFTLQQRFFLAWAQCWRQNITKERSLQLLTLDPHGPNEMRCNGPLSNMPEFHESFNVVEGSPLYKPKDTRVDIW